MEIYGYGYGNGRYFMCSSSFEAEDPDPIRDLSSEEYLDILTKLITRADPELGELNNIFENIMLSDHSLTPYLEFCLFSLAEDHESRQQCHLYDQELLLILLAVLLDWAILDETGGELLLLADQIKSNLERSLTPSEVIITNNEFRTSVSKTSLINLEKAIKLLKQYY